MTTTKPFTLWALETLEMPCPCPPNGWKLSPVIRAWHDVQNWEEPEEPRDLELWESIPKPGLAELQNAELSYDPDTDQLFADGEYIGGASDLSREIMEELYNGGDVAEMNDESLFDVLVATV